MVTILKMIILFTLLIAGDYSFSQDNQNGYFKNLRIPVKGLSKYLKAQKMGISDTHLLSRDVAQYFRDHKIPDNMGFTFNELVSKLESASENNIEMWIKARYILSQKFDSYLLLTSKGKKKSGIYSENLYLINLFNDTILSIMHVAYDIAGFGSHEQAFTIIREGDKTYFDFHTELIISDVFYKDDSDKLKAKKTNHAIKNIACDNNTGKFTFVRKKSATHH